MSKKYLSSVTILFLLFFLVFIMQACNYKRAKHFSPSDSISNRSSIPSLPEIEGQYGVTYTYTQNGCNDLSGEYNVTAGIRLNSSNPNWIDVLFPDAPGAISGPYDESTGNFMGETDRKSIGQGYTAMESWYMDFYPRMNNDDNILFGGISRVDVYNPDDTFNCGIDYNIMGEKTMLKVPQLIYPPNGSMNIDRDLIFEWQNLDLATSYDYQIIKEGESFENANSFSQSGLTSNMYSIEGLEFSTNYEWRVRATYDNLKSEWSSPWSFTTKDEPATAYDLTVEKEGEGSVSSTPSGINCGDDCSEEYEEGTEVTLTAEPAEGWVFDGWSGDVPEECVDSTDNCSVKMDKDRTVKAVFKEEVGNLIIEGLKVCIEHGNTSSKILWLFVLDEIWGYGQLTLKMRVYLPPDGDEFEDIEVETLEEFQQILFELDIATYGNYDWEIISARNEATGQEIEIEGEREGTVEVGSQEQNAGECEM
ncbi:MAG: fibronectin type III domain-containing protein [Balneolaceae bacterium]|nr:fibronectin type III domain-containing protein [Balneolaceae bacterium]